MTSRCVPVRPERVGVPFPLSGEPVPFDDDEERMVVACNISEITYARYTDTDEADRGLYLCEYGTEGFGFGYIRSYTFANFRSALEVFTMNGGFSSVEEVLEHCAHAYSTHYSGLRELADAHTGRIPQPQHAPTTTTGKLHIVQTRRRRRSIEL